jgi:aconitate hydratase
LSRVDDTFARREREIDSGVLVAGENYGQGSSREHAALCPMYLGVEAVFAQSFARIHKANLFNFGIVPFTIDEETYDRIEQGDDIQVLGDVASEVRAGTEEFTIRVNDDWEAPAYVDGSSRERDIVAAGGKLPYTKHQATGAGAAPADD